MPGVFMSRSEEGTVALLPEPFVVDKDAVDKAAAAARAAAARISEGHRRRSDPHAKAEPAPPAEAERKT